MTKLKYNKNHIYSTSNNLKITVSQTGSKSMIKLRGETEYNIRQGYRVMVDDDTIAMGGWNESKEEVMMRAIKYERYAHLVYKELYYDLLGKLASIGLVQASEDESDDSNETW